MGRLRLPTLCFITDRHQCPNSELDPIVQAAIDGGANVIQLREKDLPAGELYSLGINLRRLTRGKALLLINDRCDVAQACGADGVHLPETSLPTAMARWIMGRQTLVGRSVHHADAAVQAERDGADLVQFGPIFATPSKPDAKPVGIEALREVASAVAIPVLAVGGINKDNAAEVIEAGASGAAVISAICGAEGPKEATEALVKAMNDAWRQRVEASRATA
jgi:thiamine-phosphate pyrophosphorylase